MAREVGKEGSVHFSKQEMNSSCCGHLSLERKKGGGGLDVQSPCYPLKPKSEPETPTELPASFSPLTQTRGSLE